MDAESAEAVPADTLTVTGLVDGLAGGYLSGWAIDPRRAGPCEIVVRDDTHALVARGMADRPRRDLAAYEYGRCDFGFRLDIETLGQAAALHVYADGAELSGSPLATGAGSFDGALAVLEGDAEGWVHARALPFAPPAIRLFDQDGRCVGEGEAVLEAGDRLFTPARFRIALDRSVYRHAELGLRAEADGVAFAATLAKLTVQGVLDEVGEAGCRGWLMCLEAPSVRLPLELRRDGVLMGSTVADRPREDLRAALPDRWRIGFAITLNPPPDPMATPCAWSLRIAGCDAELFDGPVIVAPARGFVATARELARSAHTLDLGPAERAVLQGALAAFIDRFRDAAPPRVRGAGGGAAAAATLRFSVVIPVYRNVALTQACIDSVLAHRDAAHEAVVVLDDASPDEGMAELLEGYAVLPRVTVLSNPRNLGFVRSVNRALGFCRGGDVILLNSDTVVFAGGLAEMWRVAGSAPDIGSATALSNNATIFSYPEMEAGGEALADIGWAAVAAAALAGNAGKWFDVPTGHGFCLLLRRALLNRVGALDEAFGRGYGEENDLCLRAADLGFRHVAAAGAFVEHRESASFGAEKAALQRTNLAILNERYPEYAADVQDFIRRDGLRGARWAIDAHRLRAAGLRHVLVLGNWLGGGTLRAIGDIGRLAGYGGAIPLELLVTRQGRIDLACAAPALRAVFQPGEYAALFQLLDGVAIEAMLIHQLLGHETGFIAALRGWSRNIRRTYYLHDYYPVCPRVTLIDAAGEFCGVPATEVCARCVALAGVHDAARMNAIDPAAHRAMFGTLLAEMDAVVAPSASAAGYLARGLPNLKVVVAPHPEPVALYEVEAPAAIGPDVVLLGAMGPHKGSGKLLEVARRARLVAPALRFHVIGYTDIDRELHETGNVVVSGPYAPAELAGLVAMTGAAIALFLPRSPETFSYTLSEAVQLGLIPLVPDIGAPADRVRAAGYGHVFGFPIDAAEVVTTILRVIDGTIDAGVGGAGPRSFAVPPHAMYAGEAYAGAALPSGLAP